MHLQSNVSDQLAPRSSIRQVGGPEAIEALHLASHTERRALQLGVRLVTVDESCSGGAQGPFQCDGVRISEGGHLLLLDAGGDVIRGWNPQGWFSYSVASLELS